MQSAVGSYCTFTSEPPPFVPASDDDFEMPSAGDYAPRPVEWLWPGRIPIGKVTLLAGDPGLGKSLVALDVAARVSSGSAWPEQQHDSLPTLAPAATPDSLDSSYAANDATNPTCAASNSPLPAPRSVIILSAEDDVADTIRPRLDAHGANPHRVFFLPGLADLRHDFAQLEAALDRAPDCRLIIVDPVNAYVGPSDSHFHTIFRKVLEPLAKLAAKRKIAILAVTHLRKNEGAAIYRATGSMGFVAAARTVWTICRDQTDPSRTLFLSVKNNLCPLGAGLAYTIESHDTIDAPVIRWQSGPITVSAQEALGSQPKSRGPEAEDRRNAGEWLKIALADGPCESWLILREGKQNGFHERTVQRALHAIGGITKKNGFLGGWLWSLPQHGAPAQHAAPAQYDPSVQDDTHGDVEKLVAFDETCRLRENAERNGHANHADPAPPPPDSATAPTPPTVAESIRHLDRLHASRNGQPPARPPRPSVRNGNGNGNGNSDSSSPTGHAILDRLLAEFCGPLRPRPEASKGKIDNPQRSTDDGPPTKRVRNKKSARSPSRLLTGTDS